MLTDLQIANNKNEFLDLLMSVKREGMGDLIEYLETTDFFDAPASTMYHENYTGGLCEHSLKVFNTLRRLDVEFELGLSKDSMIITALLHDVCKINTYFKDKKNQKIGQNWVTVDWWRREDSYPIGHGQKSVIMLLEAGLKLEKEEILSIASHMGEYDTSNMFNPSSVFDKNDRAIWLHIADLIATYKDRNVE